MEAMTRVLDELSNLDIESAEQLVELASRPEIVKAYAEHKALIGDSTGNVSMGIYPVVIGKMIELKKAVIEAGRVIHEADITKGQKPRQN
jgi:hypothetical protein